MKTLLLLIITISIVTSGFCQIIERNEDYNGKELSAKEFMKLDPEFSSKLVEQKAKTILTSAVNKAAAAVPFGAGTVGVAMELGISNLKLDELLVANQNYNYKLTNILGNVLKTIKETRDGNFMLRAENSARKIDVVDKTLNAIDKCEKTRDAIKALGRNGDITAGLLKAVKAVDESLNSLEKLGVLLEEKYNTVTEENQAIAKSEEKIEEINKQMDAILCEAQQEVRDKVVTKYNRDYNSALINGAMYSGISKTEAAEKVTKNLHSSKNALIGFRNIMWLVVGIFFMVAITAGVWKIFFAGDESILIIKYLKSEIVGMAICVFLSGVLERCVTIITGN